MRSELSTSHLDIDDGKVPFPTFHEYEHTILGHTWMFKAFILEFKIMHEDVKMNLFVSSPDLLKNWNIRDWYEGLPPKKFPSLGHLIEAFIKQ